MSKHIVYIVITDKIKAGSLRKFLLNQFPKQLYIYIFFSIPSVLKFLDTSVDMIIDDYELPTGQTPPGKASLKRHLEHLPTVSLVSFTSLKEVSDAVMKMQGRKIDKQPIRRSNRHSIAHLIERRITQPLRVLYAEYGVLKFVGIFILTFILMAAVVVWIVNSII